MAGRYGVSLGDLAAALSATGANKDFVRQLQEEEDRRRLQLSDPQPAAVEPPPSAPRTFGLPPGTQEALKRTGSGYKVPDAPADVPEQELGLTSTERSLPENPYVDHAREGERELPGNPYESVGQSDFNPRASQKQLRQQYAQTQNERLDNITDGGDAQAMAARRQGDVYGAQGSELNRIRQDAEGRVNVNRAQKDALEQEALARLDAMNEMMANPPRPSTMQKVLGILTAVASTKSGGGAVAGGQMLGQLIGQQTAAWQQNIAQHGHMANQMLELLKAQNADSDSELDHAKMLSGLVVSEYDTALKQVASDAKSDEIRNAAIETRADLRNKFVVQQMQLNEQAAAQRKKQGLAAQDTALLSALSQVDESERPMLAAQYGERGLKLLEHLQKPIANQADVEGKRASAEKDMRTEGGGVGTEVLPGYVDTVGVDKPTITEVRKNAQAMESLISDLGRLRALRTKNGGGTWDQNDAQEAQNIMGGMSTKLSQFNGAGAPSEGERELFMKGLTDPTGFYMFKDPEELYTRMARDFRNGFNSKLKSIGIMPKDTQRASSLGFQPDQEGKKKPGISDVVANRGQ